MRNLKKILALVLALVMSLSLMAAAGAASFPDVDDDNPYATAIDVLDQLKVFQGYKEDGTFRPTETLNRAQAAVLVYRIATGDVEDKYLDNYTFMQQSKFTDLDGYTWAKGYINYCQNAGIVIGTTATTFDPGAKVTGYQLLVMLLRTLGYGKAGEFTDPKTWEIQTASIAESVGILNHVTGGDFGAPAQRQMVAEILFRGLLTPTVTYSQLTSGGYTPNETLGKREFGLEAIEGVITANEWANLDDVDVLNKGKTLLRTDDKDYTLDITTPITYIGENFSAYIAKSKVLTLENTGNTVWEPENGKASNISTSVKFEKATGLKANGDTEYFWNFDKAYETRSDWTIRYRVNVADAPQWVKEYLDSVGAQKEGTAPNQQYVRTFPFNTEIPDTDIEIMRDIFRNADRNEVNPDPGSPVGGFVKGEVYAGTSSLKDLSDSKAEGGITWKEFQETYLKPVDVTSIPNSRNGQWLKVVDNNGDGVAEYVFLTNYWLDEVVSSYKNKDGDTVMQYNRIDDDDNRFEDKVPTIYMDGTERVERDVAVGDVVLIARIDNQFLVSKADSVTTSATSYNYKDDVITAANGETYGQSGIVDNYTDMQSFISTMAPNTEYEMFLDKFGYVRAYRQPGGTKYALITELYYTNGQYGNIEQNWPMTAELTMPDEEGKAVTKEYPVAAASAGNMRAAQPWALVNSMASTGNYYNWVQPAIAHLGVTASPYNPTKGVPTWDDSFSTYWPANLQLIKNITGWPAGLQEFNYGAQTYGNTTLNADGSINWDEDQVEGTGSFTNVAVVTGDDTVTLTGAARLNIKSDGVVDAVHPYAVDYIQLSTDRPAAAAASYKISNNDESDDNSSTGYEAKNNYFVDATKDTEIYVVYNGGVEYFKGYANMPALKEETVGKIHAAYAVAHNTNTGVDAKNYWVADVIVYEVEKWNDLNKASVSLAYFTALQQVQSANGVTISTLNSKTDPAKVSLVPSNLSWNNSNNWNDAWGFNASTFGWNGYGFYRLFNETAPVDGVMTARQIRKITKDFNDNGIYAGTVTREIETALKGGYLPVNIDGTLNTATGELATETRVSISESKIYSITTQDNYGSSWNYYEAENLQYSNVQWSEVKAGDKIIWVGDNNDKLGVSSSSFIVDLGNPDYRIENPLLNNYQLWLDSPEWLSGTFADVNDPTTWNGGLWNQIDADQAAHRAAVWTIEYTVVDEDGNEVTLAADDSITPADLLQSQAGKAAKVEAVIDGYDVKSMEVTTLNNEGKPAADCYMDSNGDWYLNNISKNIEVTVTVTPTVEKYTVTVKDSTGATIGEPIVVPANSVKTIDVTKAPYARAGKEISGVSADAAITAAVSTTPASVPANGAAEKITLTNVGANGTITLTYRDVTNQVTANLVTMGTGVDVTYDIAAVDTTNNTAVTNQTVTDGTAFSGSGKLKYGGAVTMKWNGAANTTYAVSAEENCTYVWVKQVVGGAHELKVTTDGSAELTITGTTQPFVTLDSTTSISGATVKAADGTTALPATILVSETPVALQFKATAGAGTRITKVEYQVAGTAAKEATVVDASTGIYEIPADAFAVAGTVTIIVTAVSTAGADVKLKSSAADNPSKTAYYSVKKYGSETWSQPAALTNTGVDVELAIGDQVKFTSDCEIEVTAATTTVTGADVKGYTVVVEITNPGTSGSLTVANKT